MKTILLSAPISIVIFIAAYLYLPLGWFEQTRDNIGSTITVIQGTDTLRDSRAVINTNFSNLNADKLESGSVASSLTIVAASTTRMSCLSNCAFGSTATSTFNTAGALTLATSLTVANGGTGTSTFMNGGITFYDSVLGTLSQGSSQASLFFDKTNSRLGIGSSTPAYALSIGAQKAIGVQEYAPATSTSMTIDARNGNQQLVQIGTSATTIGFSNFGIGTTIRLFICNPGSSAGAITWSGVRYFGGTPPSQTTTAGKCDMYVVGSTAATSTGATTPILWLAQGGAAL